MEENTQNQTWVLPNRLDFPEWIYENFHPRKYKSTSGNASERARGVKQSPHQKLIKDLLNSKSPYRGLLLFHGLGVGKTRASILTAEDFIKSRKKVVVMLPASLQKNFRNELLNSSDVGQYRWKKWYHVKIDTTKPTHVAALLSIQEEFPFDENFIKKNTKSNDTSLWIPYIPEGVEIPRMALGESKDLQKLNEKDFKEAIKCHDHLIDHTYEFINYNGLKKTHLTTKYKANFFDDKLVIIDEAHNFIAQSMKEENISSKLYSRLMNGKNTRFLLLTGTPMINQPFELAYLMNLIRGPISSVRYSFDEKIALPLDSDIEAALLNTTFGDTSIPMANLVDYFNLSKGSKERTVEFTLLPPGFVRAHGRNKRDHVEWNDLLDPESHPMSEFKESFNLSIEKACRLGLTLKACTVVKGSADWLQTPALPIDKTEFEKLFLDKSDPEVPKHINDTLFIQRVMGLTSYFKGNDPKYFPTKLPMIVRKMPLSEHQFVSYIDNRHDEQKLEKRSSLSKARRGGQPSNDDNTVYRTFSRMACNFVFPKDIKRSFPMTIRAAMREMELTMTDKEDIEKKVDEKYEAERHAAMSALEENKAEFLSIEGLKAKYSPKMGQILEDLMTNPGKGLFYSQFREMEGVGIFTLALKAQGWVELDVTKKEDGSYKFKNTECLKPEFNNKRFIVFNQDRTRSDILLRLFNGEWTDMPKEAQKLLKVLNQTTNITENLRGNLAKLMMITQSGAEGISLKHVRQVYILEPFWNQVRIDQVIGRAVRTNSHVELPPTERNVQVFMYISTFTKSQIERDHTMRHLDHEMTSDEHILRIASTKRHMIEEFENSLKRSSIDCLNNARPNRILEDKLQCYVAPHDAADEHVGELSYVTDLKQHQQLQDKRERLIKRTTIEGKVVHKRNQKYVKVPNASTLYDHNAYVNAGVLIKSPK
jgi:superfamily II DNA or RNA helicase